MKRRGKDQLVALRRSLQPETTLNHTTRNIGEKDRKGTGYKKKGQKPAGKEGEYTIDGFSAKFLGETIWRRGGSKKGEQE